MRESHWRNDTVNNTKTSPQTSLPFVRELQPFPKYIRTSRPFADPGAPLASERAGFVSPRSVAQVHRLRGSAIRMGAFLKIVCTYVAAPTEANVVPRARHSDSSRYPRSVSLLGHARQRRNGTLSFAFAPLSTLHSCWRIFTLHDTFALDQDRSVTIVRYACTSRLTDINPPPRRILFMVPRQLALLSSIWRACMRARARVKYLLIRN